MATMTELAPTPALPAEPPSARDERISFKRLLWVGPLTVAAALAATYAIGLALRALDPSLSRMGQLGPPLLLLTAEGAIGAVIVFALMGAALRRPIFWFRVIGAAVLAVSILPDLALGLGGSTAMLGMRAMGPFLSVGMPGPSGPPPGGRPPGGGPPGGFVFPAMPLEHVAILVLLHVVVAAICIVMLTTLARDGIRPADAVGESTAGG